jgi:hypothetical protein
MPKLPSIRAREVVRVALSIGFVLDRQKGNHAVYYRAADAPVLCLLQDDNLISSVAVQCDRLLDPSGPGEVLLLIHVVVRATQMTFANVGISG